MTYWFKEFYIPERMMESLYLYINCRVRPGDFLTAVLCNDLKEAVGRADDENMRNLPAYVAYLYNKAPAICWGSKGKFIDWVEKKKGRIKMICKGSCKREVTEVCQDGFCRDCHVDISWEDCVDGTWLAQQNLAKGRSVKETKELYPNIKEKHGKTNSS